MKKTLIALAAVAATGAAFAQSSVTLYGVVDASVAKATGSKVALSTAGLLNNGDSRWGMRGTEDLGGGLKAGFNLEQGVNIGTGATTGATAFQRMAYMTLSGGFGEIAAGRRLTPQFYAIATYELTGTANYSAEATLFGFGGGSRNDSLITYTTPNMGGLTATLGTVLGQNNVVAGVNRSKTQFNVIYKAGPIAAALGYDKTNGAEKSLSLGGSYDLGVAKIAASMQDPTGARKGFTLGASAPMGPVTLTFDLARDTGSAVKSTNYVLESKYALSKRTFAYGVLHRTGLTSVNTFGVGVRHNF